MSFRVSVLTNHTTFAECCVMRVRWGMQSCCSAAQSQAFWRNQHLDSSQILLWSRAFYRSEGSSETFQRLGLKSRFIFTPIYQSDHNSDLQRWPQFMMMLTADWSKKGNVLYFMNDKLQKRIQTHTHWFLFFQRSFFRLLARRRWATGLKWAWAVAEVSAFLCWGSCSTRLAGDSKIIWSVGGIITTQMGHYKTVWVTHSENLTSSLNNCWWKSIWRFSGTKCEWMTWCFSFTDVRLIHLTVSKTGFLVVIVNTGII